MTARRIEPYRLTRLVLTTLEAPEVSTTLNRSIRIARTLLPALLVAPSVAFTVEEKSEDRQSRRGFRGDFAERKDLRVTRPDAIAAMRPALELVGDAGRGEEFFIELCARCHRSGLLGGGPGPDLSGVAQWSVERLLRDIVDPHAEIDTEHASHIVETVDGEVHTGLLAASSGDGVTLRLAGDILVEVPAERVRDVRSHGLSMMPEGLAAGLEAADMADLLAFLNR